MEEILKIENLHVSFDSYAGEVHAVRGVSLEVHKGEVLAIVGESGCGKSVTAQTIMKLNPMPPARIKEGSITLCGKDIVAASEKEMQGIRGQMVSMIFQDPMTCMNPTMRVGKQLTETLVKKGKISRKDAEKEAVRLLKMVQIPNAEERAKQYPHEFSGGMRQRAMIAMALACNPQLLIADEPTTALDVTIQAQILDMMNELKRETGSSFLFITHDLGVISEMADRVVVMYGGKVCETATTDELFEHAAHPYTLGLIHSRPRADFEGDRLEVIPGNVPSLNDKPEGCPFHPRCRFAQEICRKRFPETVDLNQGKGGAEHLVACWNYCEGAKAPAEKQNSL